MSASFFASDESNAIMKFAAGWVCAGPSGGKGVVKASTITSKESVERAPVSGFTTASGRFPRRCCRQTERSAYLALF